MKNNGNIVNLTKEEILIKYDYSDDELGDRLPYKDVNRDRWYHIDDILSAMDEYASLREVKWRELYGAQKEYRVLCKEESDGDDNCNLTGYKKWKLYINPLFWGFCFTLVGLAYVHGWRAKDEDIKKGEQLRQKITLLEQELGLTK